ncbi:MAG: hypothetical protein K2I64_05725 [Muribaculaceae bacterium]|nr:hypothetical protein [Muribaculaceae bacterium]
MKKSLFALLGAFMLSASQVNAATVYFDNSSTNWPTVGTWEFNGPGADYAGTTELVTIDGHPLYKAETTHQTIIFRNGNQWGQGQTDDIPVVDNAVYSGGQGASKLIANIVDGAYVAVGGGDEPVVDPTDLYIVGSFTGTWSFQPDYLFTRGDDGVYTLTGVTIEAGSSFKISRPGWPQDASYGGTDAGNNDDPATLTGVYPGQSYTLHCRNEYTTDNRNLFVRSDIINATFTFDPATKELTISENGEGEIVKQPWWCAWNVNGTWTWDHQLEKQEEGTYKIHINCSSTDTDTNYFAVFNGASATGWDDKNNTRYQPVGVTSDQNVTESKTYQMMQGNAYTWTIKNGDWTVVVDPRDVLNMTIAFEYGNSTGEANILIDNADDDDHSFKSYAMAQVEGDDEAYSWTGKLTADDRLKFNIHGVDYYFDPSVVNSITESAGSLVIEYPLKEVAADGSVSFDYPANTTFVVNVTDRTATLTQAAAPDVTVTVTNGENSTIHKLDAVNGSAGVYTCAHSFKLTAGTDQVDFRVHAKRYAPVFAATESRAAGDLNFTLTELPNAQPAPVWAGQDTENVYLTVKTSDMSGVSSTTVYTGISEIEINECEAVYYNLQGIRVDNPVKGLFIVKQGEKTYKVVK